MTERGGLLSLVGTNDFYAMIGFLKQGATPTQRKKIGLVQDFLARSIASGMLRLTSDGADVRVMVVTGRPGHLPGHDAAGKTQYPGPVSRGGHARIF